MNKLFRKASKAMVCLLLAPLAVSSCYDDSEIWETLNDHEAQLNELRTELNNQADAMAALLSDGSTIKNCVKQSDGSYLVTLSNGTKFKAFPEQTNVSTLMSYVVINGDKYWALYTPAGELEPITDAQGKNIPVSVQVDVEVKNGKYYVVINGYEYETGYDAEDAVQVFESCVPHADATGNVYAMTFTFGEGLEVTVSVDGYKGVIFKLENLGASAQVVTEYYVPYTASQSFLLDMEGVIDYVMQIPHGWKVVERVDEQSGNAYLDVTAPSKTAVEGGAAFDRGDLKVVAVVEGGDAAITKLALSAEPFKKVEFSSTRLVAEPYAGVQKFVYGIVASDEFDQAAVIETAQTLVSDIVDAPAGYAVAEGPISCTLEQMLGAELNPNKKYVLFVVPAVYQEKEEEAVFYIDEASFQSYKVGAVIVNMSEPRTMLFDAEITVDVKGTDKMWAGTAVKTDDLFSTILYGIVNGITEPYTEGLTYHGMASQYPVEDANADVEFAPGTTYVTWCVPYDTDKATYTEADIIYKEFTTNAITSGGSLTVTAGESVITTSSISTPISSEGAEMIYYAYLTDDEGKRLGAVQGLDDQKFNLIMKSENCTLVKGNEAVASVENIVPETKMWLFAVAVDADGKYGAVNCQSASLEKVVFSSLTVSYVEDGCSPGSDEMDYQVAVSGGTPVRYIYWIGTPMDPLWVKCGKDKNALAKYMAVYPEDEAITRVMRTHGDIAADGKITVTGLRMEEEYIMMVLAQDESGAFSKGAYKKMTTLAADLGVVRTEGSDLWNAAKESIHFDWIEEAFQAAANQGMMARYAFNFSCPQDYTAFILCASDSYFSEAGFTKTTQIMIEIENYCSRKYDDGHTPIINGEYASEPDYYKNGELRGGQMMNVVDFYVHGLPTMGFATYFAPDSHGEGNCIYWENGEDVNYLRALRLIEEYKTLAKYEEKAAAFGLKGQEAADWAKALLEAYLPYYEEAEPLIYFNNGEPLYMMNPYAMGVDDKGQLHDRVVVMLKDREGNYFEPMYFEVPNYFEK